MSLAFQKVVLISRRYNAQVAETLHQLIQLLATQDIEILIEAETIALFEFNSQLTLDHASLIDKDQLAGRCDLMIAIGGDGSLLKAARIASKRHIPVVGINRGKLGFLTDICPDHLETLLPIFKGEYHQESRFLLQANIDQYHSTALNDIVLLPGDTAHMIEFTLMIDGKIVSTQRADGLIIATPTGSTAYALSGGGPILTPTLDAITLVPMFPHRLSSRPLVIPNSQAITITVENAATTPFISCDGQKRHPVSVDQPIHISTARDSLSLIHPKSYDYFRTLQEKLGWL